MRSRLSCVRRLGVISFVRIVVLAAAAVRMVFLSSPSSSSSFYCRHPRRRRRHRRRRRRHRHRRRRLHCRVMKFWSGLGSCRGLRFRGSENGPNRPGACRGPKSLNLNKGFN